MTATIGKPYSKYKDYAESYHVAGTRPEDSQWRGALAGVLGYSGPIHQFAYDLASEGKDSYGRQLRKYQKNSRPAICDVTLNAPKSLSVEALVHDNPLAIAAHDRGVDSALQFTSRHLLFSQVKLRGKVSRVHTDQALIGSFRQRDNREGEPHLHTHNVIFNVGNVAGKWRSLANEQIYLNKLTIGAIYQNDAAYHLHTAGYRTYWDANGQFELVGNPKRLLEETFAQRTARLEAYLAEQGLDRERATPKQLDAANRATRKQKAYDKDAEEQVSDWQDQAATAGIRPCQPIPQQELEFLFQSALSPGSPQEIVTAAAQRLSENASAFGYMELVRVGCRLSQGRYLSSEIQKAVETSRELIPIGSNTPYPAYTTRTILQRESQILDWAIQGKSSCAAISEDTKATVAAQKFTLNSGQTKALQHIASSRDLITLIQGSAGVGKTRSLSALKDLMGERTLIGCAVGGLQAEALEADSGISSQTLESLIRTKPEEFPRDTLIVVDEAGVVSNRQMHQLLERASESKCRLLLVGDTKQLSAVEQGNPFQLLQTKAGLETAFISQNMRQKDSQLKAVVDLCEAQRPAEAFDLLNSQGKISSIPTEEQRIEAIAADYLTRPLEQRRNTLIMATTHKERATLTQAIRDKLIQQGTLSGPAMEIEVLQKKDLDRHDLLIADHYQVGDLVRFWRNSGQFAKGELYRVTAIDPAQHSVELVDPEGQTVTLDLYRYKDREVFSPQLLEIRAGEEMRFTAGLKDHNGKQVQVNGQKFRVEAIDPETQTIEISTKGKRLTVAPEDLLHSDYRWISTVHSLQGATAQYAIFAAGQGNGALLSRESWYVAASRASLEFAVYCPDSKQLKESIQSSRAQRPAIDLIHSATPTPTREPAAQQLNVAFELQAGQLLKAIADYIELAALEAALTQPLVALLEELTHLEAQGVNKGLSFNPYLEAISGYISQEAIELEILPALENLVAQLNTLQPGFPPALGPASPESEISEQVPSSITSFISPAAVESEITSVLNDLTGQLTQLQPEKSNSTEQQYSATSTLLQQETISSAVEAISNYVEHSAVSGALNPQSLQALLNLLDHLGDPELNAAMQRIETIVIDYRTRLQAQALMPEALPIPEAIADSGEKTAINEVIAPTPPPPSDEFLAAQFQILTDQILAPEAVYQDQGKRISRSNGRLTAEIEGTEVDIHKPENLASFVNHLQALLNEFQLLSLYEEFQEAARLEKAILHRATEIVQLNQGNYQSQGVSVEITGSSLEIKLDRDLVFKSNQGSVQRPDDLSMMENLELQLTGTIRDLKQIISAKLEQEAARMAEEARLEAERLQAETEATRRVIKPQEKGHGHGLAL